MAIMTKDCLSFVWAFGVNDLVHSVISYCHRILGIIVGIAIYYALETSNDLDYLVQLRDEKRYLIKTEWELDMSNFTHDIELNFGAINDVERSIFTYMIIQNKNVKDLWNTTNTLPTTRKAKTDFNLCLSERYYYLHQYNHQLAIPEAMNM